MKIRWIPAAGLIIAFACFVTGCSSEAIPSAAPQTSAAPQISHSGSALMTEEEQKAILSDFETLLQSDDAEKEAIQAILEQSPLLSPENASRMVMRFEEYQNRAISTEEIVSQDLVDLIQSSNEPYNEKAINEVTEIQSAQLKTAVQGLFDRGYKIIIPEGNYQAVINYGVYKNFEDAVTADIGAYIEIMASESESRMSEDAGIIIPIREVLRRAQACESFLPLYPDSSKAAQVKSKYDGYVDAYFFGQNNTPAFDYFTNALQQEFLDSYRLAASESTGSAIAKAASEYLGILEKNDYSLTDAVKDYRKRMTDTLKGT